MWRAGILVIRARLGDLLTMPSARDRETDCSLLQPGGADSMMTQCIEPFPWEADTADRGRWRCRRCGFESPSWHAGAGFELCVRCQRQAERARLRPQVEPDERDRQIPHEHAVSIGVCEPVWETQKARCFQLADGRRVWIPRSCIVAIDHEHGVWVKSWFYQRELMPLLEREAA